MFTGDITVTGAADFTNDESSPGPRFSRRQHTAPRQLGCLLKQPLGNAPKRNYFISSGLGCLKQIKSSYIHLFLI